MSGALHWPGRVLAEEDLRRNLNGHRAVVLRSGTVVTPSAREYLLASGVLLDQAEAAAPKTADTWGVAKDRSYPPVAPAIIALVRDGLRVIELGCAATDLPCRWSQAVAACVARGDCRGGVVFCENPGLVCCVANKVAGLRAVSVSTIGQAARATLTLNANLLAVEMPGRTYFEVRQILRTLCNGGGACPDGVACTLRELDGHAHR
jgi:ribose 5-phosphate isomerase RpiB